MQFLVYHLFILQQNRSFKFLILKNTLFKQIKAKGTLMQLVAADWLRSDTREDDLASRPGGIVQVRYIIS